MATAKKFQQEYRIELILTKDEAEILYTLIARHTGNILPSVYSALHALSVSYSEKKFEANEWRIINFV